jgi:hypothetical protein
MGALLEAAGHGWTARPAPPEAIPEVHLRTRRLEALVPGSEIASDAVDMVAQWRQVEGQMPPKDPPR